MLILLPMLSGCGVRLPDPVLQSVEPDRGWNGEETVVSVQGANFYPQIEVNANRRDQADLDRGFSASLRSEITGVWPLGGVSAVDYEHLSAVVTPGIPSGIYDLVVVSPTGREAVLPSAYTVSDTRADRLNLSTDTVIAEVNTPKLLTIELLAPGENAQIVQTDLEIEVRIEGPSGEVVDGVFSATDLENVIVAPNGQSLTGFLGPDGVGRVSLSVGTPGQVDVTASPLDITSPIRSGTTTLQWEPGQELQALFDFPNDPMEVVAGQAFQVDVRLVDQFGNPVDEDVPIFIRSKCGNYFRALEGPEQVTVTLENSTELGNSCSGSPQGLEVALGPVGESGPIVVLPDVVSRFGVVTSTAPIRAGQTKSGQITPRDVFGNRTLYTGAIDVTDTVGGLGEIDCIPAVFDDLDCRFISTLAGEQVQLVATSGALTGVSAPYRVGPALGVDSLDVEVQGVIAAGEGFIVGLSPRDIYGNLILADDLQGATVALADELGELSCQVAPPLLDGRMAYDCTLFTARPDASISVDLDGVVGLSPDFEVVNGELAIGVVSVPGSVVAGDTFTVGILGTDAYSNPYLVQTNTVVEVFDLSGVFIGDVSLDVTGEGASSVRLIEAGTTVFIVYADGVEIGQSAPIVVQPDIGVGLQVSPLVPWAWTGTPTAVQIESIDQFGNRGSESFDVLLSSRSSSGSPITVSLSNGAATTTFTWSSPVYDEVLDGSGGGLSGASDPIDVVSDCGASGPVAVVDFAGAPSGRACWDEAAGSATLAGSLAGTVPGAALLSRYSTSVGGDAAVAAGPAFTIEVDSIGSNAVDALVADTSGCGSEVAAVVWAGLDDGNPVGEIAVTLGLSDLVIGVDASDLQIVGAVDCTGDPAAGGGVIVRSDRGELLGASPSGSGLQITLDSTGSGSFQLDASQATMGGTATVVLRSLTDGAGGATTLVFSGDDALPTVYEQDPVGDTTGVVDRVDLEFSEPMLPATLVPAAFQLDGPATVGIGAVNELGPRRWEVVLDGPINAEDGTWTLRASDSIRDLAGNRLDGGSAGVAAAWLGSFGALPGVVDPVSCVAAVARFRPDGDPGAGEEADVFRVELLTDTLPNGWIATVHDASSTTVLRKRLVPVGVSDAWEWDGRDQSERVVSDGDYTVIIEPEDGFGNLGQGCSLPVEVANEGGR